MPIAPLSDDDVARIASAYGLNLTGQDAASFRALAATLLTSYDEVERRHEASLPERPSRAWRRPPEAENPLGAWYVTTEIGEHAGGPLAGRPVAIKDNIEVAGVPMMNGSAVVEGFVPRRDATVVTRLLAAGAVVTGKAVCENLCFSGGSHTSATGPVRNPWDHSRSAGGSSSGSAALVAAGHADLALGDDQGPITRTVTDAALMLGVLAGPDGLDPRQGPPGQPDPRRRADQTPGDYLAGLDAGVAGLRVGVLAEGFGF